MRRRSIRPPMPVRVRSRTASKVESLRFPDKKRLDEFEIANGGGVQHHAGGTIVERGPFEMIDRRALRFPRVVQQRGRRADR